MTRDMAHHPASRVASRGCLAAAVLAAWLVLPSSAAAISVRDVIELSKAGVSDEVLVELVETGGSVFYLSAGDILELRQAGVSDRVVLAMVRSERAWRNRDEAREDAIAEVRLMAELIEATRAEVEAARRSAPIVVSEPAPQVVPVPYPMLVGAGRGGRNVQRSGVQARGARSAPAPSGSPSEGAVSHPEARPHEKTASRPGGRPFWVVNGSGWIVK